MGLNTSFSFQQFIFVIIIRIRLGTEQNVSVRATQAASLAGMYV
jgi:hypothetical protein